MAAPNNPRFVTVVMDLGLRSNPNLHRAQRAPDLLFPFVPLYEYDTANPCTQGTAPPDTANKSGIVFFPGRLPLYRNGMLVGGLGVSGDGVDEDDFVTAGAVEVACRAGGPCGITDFQGSPNIRADQVVIANVRLPYLKFPRNPTK
jgi:hypothetical protein